MKKSIGVMTVMMFMVCSVFASFPVNKTNVEKQQRENLEVQPLEASNNDMEANMDVAVEDALSPAVAASGSYNMWIALGLWFFLGGLAAHRWYAKKPIGWNILFILTLGGLGIWYLVDGIMILTQGFE